MVQGVDKKSHSERESLTALEPQEVSMAQIIDHYSTEYQPQATQFRRYINSFLGLSPAAVELNLIVITIDPCQ